MKVLMLLSLFSLLVFGFNHDLSDNLDDDEKDLFCALINHKTESYIDLSQLTPTPNKRTNLPDSSDNKSRNNQQSPITPKTRWLVKGWDYDSPCTYNNFTLSICSSAITSKQQEEPDFPLTNSTGAYFFDNSTKEYISIGNFNTKPILLGDRSIVNRKITLRYANGSICPNGNERRSTLINFVCDREIQTNAQINFLGSLHDCAYMFEVRSIYACQLLIRATMLMLNVFFWYLFVFFLVEVARRQMLKMISSNSSSHHNNSSYFSNNRGDSYQTRWEIIENEPKWKMVIKFIVNKVSRIPNIIVKRLSRENMASKYQINTGAYSRISNPFSQPNNNEGTIRLSASDRSQDSFIRDMEIQNNILDNLDRYNTNSPSSLVPTDNNNSSTSASNHDNINRSI
ncbi:hypothetical protein TPHA_0A02410 [Tetrapisispora phaffii CBS 4417]|uniref:MRH domain-containing protein n=1 Tax=Tetrapisispora phaffii (strain ATCC 24235 / CBS 4417 / NBRC 1672 / NRRL Y-8282 / UCD 70-5) TaxID=1071381 RepID=G8BN45_TETPH|nr:hypothetical protein TPHA_0A02410 [Tetrapisispora phaffii CBS 4417]CCE61323.1 hypothetical protein TPHA_0A02410 [Tetrapisispora phaffii CBS 4417]